MSDKRLRVVHEMGVGGVVRRAGGELVLRRPFLGLQYVPA